MISYITGSLGYGKSVLAVNRAAKDLLAGKVLATNVEFLDGWEMLVAKHFPSCRWSKKEQRRVADELQRRYLYQPDVVELSRTFIKGHGEGRGRMMIDETQLTVGNRKWNDERQQELIDELTHCRKRGWYCDFIAQHADNTDVAVRRIAGEEIRCVNWKKLLRVPLMGTDLLPRPLFLAMAFQLNAGQVRSGTKPVWRQLYRLGWQSNLYDTFQEFVNTGLPPDQRVYLPSDPHERASALARRRLAAADSAQAATAASRGAAA